MSEDDLREDILDLDAEYGMPLNISTALVAKSASIIQHQMNNYYTIVEFIKNEQQQQSKELHLLVIPTDRYFFQGMSLKNAKDIRLTAEKCNLLRPIMVHQNLFMDK